MDRQELHNLAVAYASARLSCKQVSKVPSTDELYDFIYDYRFALEHIEEQAKQYPTI